MNKAERALVACLSVLAALFVGLSAASFVSESFANAADNLREINGRA